MSRCCATTSHCCLTLHMVLLPVDQCNSRISGTIFGNDSFSGTVCDLVLAQARGHKNTLGCVFNVLCNTQLY